MARASALAPSACELRETGMNNYLMLAKNQKFHGYFDIDHVFTPGRVSVTKETKYFVIREREVSYRFYPHFHPYVGQLAQRLLRKGTSGLQAADTEYADGKASLPGSLEVALAA